MAVTVYFHGVAPAHEGQSLLGVVAVDRGGREVSLEFEVSLSWLLTLQAGRQGGLFVEEGKEGEAGASPVDSFRELLEIEVGGEDFWPEPQVAFIEVEERGGGSEKHAVFTFESEIDAATPDGAGILVRLNPDAPFTLVLLFQRDGVQERRSQVLFPGEESRAYPLVDSEAESVAAAAPGADTEINRVGAVAEAGGGTAFLEYFRVGFRHIIGGRKLSDWGLDHILFVLALFFLSAHWRPLVLQITCFTLAHTVTLGLGVAGWVDLPARLVEPAIAASIAFVALENLWRERLGRGRIAVVILFGLLHGLGFAGFLSGVGLAKEEFFQGLLGFNVGVEAGQLLIVLIAFLLFLPLRKRAFYRQKIALPASLIIAGIGLWWAFERIFLTAGG